jgi:hypothetical protein
MRIIGAEAPNPSPVASTFIPTCPVEVARATLGMAVNTCSGRAAEVVTEPEARMRCGPAGEGGRGKEVAKDP